MRLIKTFLLLLTTLQASFNLSAKEYNILNSGAKSDTSFLSTSAIQAAIDECSANGGGVVLVPAGHFKIGTLILKSNVNLHLENGAILYGSRNLNDYIKLKPAYVSLRTQEATVQLIYAENANNVSITGHGEIDGRGSGFKKLDWNDEGITRPHLLRFITCTNILIENISLRNSGCWMQHYLACDLLQIRGVRVFNRNNYNNDALDLDGCRNVTISDFIADSDDDGITLKSTSPRACINIAISNCVISSRCNGIKLGTETNGGFKNISITNCIIKPSEFKDSAFFGLPTGISGIALEIVDGGTMEGVIISNIQIEGTESPLFIRLGNRARPYKKDMIINNIGNLRDITISNIRAVTRSKMGCSITGMPGFPVKNIRLSNIDMKLGGGGIAEDITRGIEEKAKDYPEATMFGTLPAYGFYIRHALNISFEAIDISNQSSDARPMLYLDDVKESKFQNMQINSNKETQANIWMKDCHNILVKDNVNSGKSPCFVKLEDKNFSEIFLINNFLRGTDKLFISEKSVEGAVFEKGNNLN
jgi:polygalacturonase